MVGDRVHDLSVVCVFWIPLATDALATKKRPMIHPGEMAPPGQLATFRSAQASSHGWYALLTQEDGDEYALAT